MRMLTALVLIGMIGCASSGQRYHDTNMDFGSIRSVAVMPFVNYSRDNLAGDRVRDVFSTMLLATGSIYVVAPGEVARAVAKIGVPTPTTPTAEDVQKLGTAMKVDAIITGVVREYGEVRSGNASGNVVSVSVQMLEVATGKVVWTASSTKGGITTSVRLLGGGGEAVNDVTEAVVDDLLSKLFS